MQISGGVLAEECAELLRTFFRERRLRAKQPPEQTRLTSYRPYLRSGLVLGGGVGLLGEGTGLIGVLGEGVGLTVLLLLLANLISCSTITANGAI